MTKRVLILLLIAITISSCSNRRFYDSITVYDWNDEAERCVHTTVDHPGKIVINTRFNFIKANVFGEEKKFKIDSYKNGYPIFYFKIFGRSRGATSITVKCNNGYKFYVKYGMYCILTIPDDGDGDECDDKIFYSL